MNHFNLNQDILIKKTTLVLCTLFAIDLIFLILHMFYSLDILDSKKFKTSTDGGYGEMFQYFKYIFSGIILFYLGKILHERILIFWSILAIFLFFDDWMRLHEHIGGKFLGSAIKSFVPSAYHQGQVIYGIIVTLLICLIGVYFWKKSSKYIKKLSLYLFLALGLLWFSAVIIDYIHAIWPSRHYNLPYVLLEEGGEHIAASLFFWICIRELFARLDSNNATNDTTN